MLRIGDGGGVCGRRACMSLLVSAGVCQGKGGSPTFGRGIHGNVGVGGGCNDGVRA